MTNMITLEHGTEYPNKNQFTVSLGQGVPRTCYIFKGDGDINIMQESCMLAANWSQEEIDQQNALNAMTPLVDGDTVIFEGEQLIVQVNGPYSNLGLLVTKKVYAETLEKREEKKRFFEARDIAKKLFEKYEKGVTVHDIQDATTGPSQAKAVADFIMHLSNGAMI